MPLEKTIDITFERIFELKEINTQIRHPKIKGAVNIIHQCFRFDNQVYHQQND